MARERSSDSGGKVSDVSLIERTGFWRNSNQSPLAKRRGLSTRAEEEVGDRGKEGTDDKKAAFPDGDGVLENLDVVPVVKVIDNATEQLELDLLQGGCRYPRRITLGCQRSHNHLVALVFGGGIHPVYIGRMGECDQDH